MILVAIRAAVLLFLAPPAAMTATLRVGPGMEFATPSQAAAVAGDGDEVVIAPGEYYDCAIWRADRLTVRGPGPDVRSDVGPGVVLTDTACAGKAAFVASGRDLVLRDLTFARIRVADRNGAGLRVEAGRVTVERGRFVRNQIGVLAAGSPDIEIVLRDCVFEGDGLSDDAPGGGAPGGGRAADILAGGIALLRVEGSRFLGAKGGPLITSAAARTEFSGNRLEAAAQPYVIGVSGGGLAMSGDEIALVGEAPRLGAILMTGEGGATLSGVTLANRTGSPAVLLRDWSGDILGGGAVTLSGNVVAAGDTEVTTDGALLHHVKEAAHEVIAWLRGVAGQVRRLAARGLRLVGA